MNRKIYFVAIIALGVLSMSVALNTKTSTSIQKVEESTPRNLKVLPEDISNSELKKIMRGFTSALGVKCNHCHAPKEEGKGLDFASDAKHEKLIARGMMQMTQHINEDYFYKYQESDVKIPKVSCVTCHNKKKTPKK